MLRVGSIDRLGVQIDAPVRSDFDSTVVAAVQIPTDQGHATAMSTNSSNQQPKHNTSGTPGQGHEFHIIVITGEHYRGGMEPVERLEMYADRAAAAELAFVQGVNNARDWERSNGFH